MEITIDVIAKFVTRTATDEERLAVLDACRTDLGTAHKVITGFAALQEFETPEFDDLCTLMSMYRQRIAKRYVIKDILEEALKPE